MNTIVLHHRLPKDDVETLDALAGNILSRQAVASMLLSAALAAVRNNPDKLKFPPSFAIGEPEASNALNETSKKPKK